MLQTLAHPHWGHVKGAHGVARHGVSTQLHDQRLRVELRPHFLHHAAKQVNMLLLPTDDAGWDNQEQVRFHSK